MLRSLPSRIQLSERDVYQTLQQVIVERAVRQQLESLRINELASCDLRYCQPRATSPWSPPSSSPLTMPPTSTSTSSSSSSGILCTPSDSEERDVFDTRNACLLAASSPSPREENWSAPPSFLLDDEQIPARLVRARLTVNHRRVRVRVRDGRRESTGSLENEEDDLENDGSPLEQSPLAQTLPDPRHRIRRVVGSGHHGAFL